METKYFIYFNWTAEPGKKAIIHKGECAFCNNGHGIHPDKSDKHGRWLGPYRSREEAYEKAQSLGAARVEFCKKE